MDGAAEPATSATAHNRIRERKRGHGECRKEPRFEVNCVLPGEAGLLCTRFLFVGRHFLPAAFASIRLSQALRIQR